MMNATVESGQWPFGLTAEQEQRAVALHRNSIIIDMVNQHPGGANIYKAYQGELAELVARRVAQLEPGMRGVSQSIFIPYELALEGKSDLIKEWWDLSGITVGTLHIPMGNLEALAGPLQGFVQLVEDMPQLPWLRLVTTAAEIRQAKQDGVHALYGYWQPTSGLNNQLNDIDKAYGQGLRILMLTYNRMDFVGTGCTERCDAGLSMFGVDVVKRCNELGIIVDTSHCGKQTTLDACRFSSTPVFANHTCAQGVYRHDRGKSDEELSAIAETGGVIGVVTVPFFLSADPRATIEVMLDHIDYIVDMVGWQHVGIGTDWPLQGPIEVIERTLGTIKKEVGFRDQDRVSESQTLRGFEDCRDMPNITRGLVKRGYSDEQIKGILGENFLRAFEVVCG